MLLRNLVIALLTIFLASNLRSQVMDERGKPLEVVLQSMNWANVLSKDHDLTATVHFREEEEDPRLNTSNEGIYKSRQIYDSQKGEFWIPYARGTFELTFAGNEVAPVDRRYVGILIGQRDEAQEISFNGRPTRSIRKNDAIRVANPIDLLFVATNPYGFSPTETPENKKSFERVLARLESLNPNQLSIADERLDKRRVHVYRIKGMTLPASQFIPTNKIVVSSEGFDKGQVLQISEDFMKLGDKAAYESDSQLIGEYAIKYRIHWKEFQIETPNKEKVTTLLPVSISKTATAPRQKRFMNVTFEWNSFDKPKKELRSIESGEKIANEFDSRINIALNR